MKTAQIALLACFLCALCNKAEAYDYPNPLWDSPNITEAMWDMNGTGTILGENRQPLRWFLTITAPIAGATRIWSSTGANS